MAKTPAVASMDEPPLKNIIKPDVKTCPSIRRICREVTCALWESQLPELPADSEEQALSEGLVPSAGREGSNEQISLPTRSRCGFSSWPAVGLSFIGRNVGVDISNMFNNASLFEVERSVWKTYPCHLATS